MALQWKGTQVTAIVSALANEAVEATADELLRAANETVPFATGALAASGQVDANGLKATVSYSGPYVIRQHEDLSLRHPDPTNPQSSPRGRARWLELTAQEQSARLTAWMAARMRGGF